MIKLEKNVKENSDNDEVPGGQKLIKIKNQSENGEKKVHQNKKSKAKVGVPPPPIKPIIPNAYPNELIIQVSQLPEKFKLIQIVETFNKYGSITYVQKLKKRVVLVAFSKEEEALAAIKANNKETVCGKKLRIEERMKKVKSIKENQMELFDRTLLVFRSDSSTTEKDIKNHFSSCGKIESVRQVKRFANHFFIVLFVDRAACQVASKLHNSILKDSTINVRIKSNQPVPWDMKRTIILLNPDGLTKLNGSKVSKVFSACGEIEKCDVLCDQEKLVMLTFENEESVQKALELNDTTQNGLKIQIKLYSDVIKKNSMPIKPNPYIEKLMLLKETKRKIYIKKLPKNVTKEDISNFFTKCGPVESVTFVPKYGAIVEFKDSDGYCEAFAYFECPLKGQDLFIVPYSETKRKTYESEKLKGKKRPASNETESPVKIKKAK